MWWTILGIVIIAFIVFRIFQVRAHRQRGAELTPFHSFTIDAGNKLMRIGPETWDNKSGWQDRDRAIKVLDELIHHGSAINTPIRQQVHQNAFLTLLSSLREQWSGYPYEGAQGNAEYAKRQAQTEKSLRFLDSVTNVTYLKPPAWRRYNWQEYVFGPGKST